jgi:hypothetical protein
MRFLEICGLAEAVCDEAPAMTKLGAEVIRIRPRRVVSWGVDPERPGLQARNVSHEVSQNVPEVMKASVALDQFGGPERLTMQTLPVPAIGPDQILLRVESAGVGNWDAVEREGLFAQMYGVAPSFPYVVGSEEAGSVVTVGERVSCFRPGDRVYGLIGARVPKGGFYSQYAAVDVGQAWHSSHN